MQQKHLSQPHTLNIVFRLLVLLLSLANAFAGFAKVAEAGINEWTNIGLETQDISALAIDPNNSMTIYAGEGSHSGTMFKTSDGGSHWNTLTTGQREAVSALVIDTHAPKTLYVSSSAKAALDPYCLTGDIFKSTDGGNTWGKLLDGWGVTSLIMDPGNSMIVYAGEICNYYLGGVAKTTDGGATWQDASGGLTNFLVTDLDISRSNPLILYAGTQQGVFETTDSGGHWGSVNNGLTDLSITKIAVHPKDSNIIYTGTYTGAVFKTTDGGAHWQVANAGTANMPITSLVIDPLTPATIYVGASGGGVFRSIDAGGSWETINTGLNNLDVSSLAIDPNNSANIYAGTRGSGVFKITFLAQALSLSQDFLAFRTQTVTTASAPQTVTSTNNSNQPITLGTLALAGPNPGDFAFSSNGCNGVTLAPQANCSFSILFKPTVEGPLSAVVQIPSNAPNGLVTVGLSGSGTVPALSTVYGPPSSSNPAGTFAEPVNTATGNYFYQHTDLAMPGRGLPFVFTRTLNVQDSSNGPFGPGWTHSYNVVLTKQGDGTVIVKMGDGHEEYYDPANGGYQPRDPGVFNTLVKNADGSFTLTQKNQTRMAFNSTGQLTSISDRNGNSLSFTYNGAGNLVTIADTVGRVVSLSYNGANRLASVTDPIGRQVTYAYDANGRLVSDTDPKGGVMQYHYTAAGVLDTITDRRGNTLIANTYDANKRVVSQTNGKGAITSFAYDTPSAGQTSMTDPLGHITVHTHDILRRLVKETDALGHAVNYVYDANNNRTSVTDKNGQVTAFTYDASGNVTSKTDAKGNVSTLQYNSFNDPTKIVDALGNTTNFAYDAKGNLVSITDALGHVTAITYDANGQPLSVTDPLNRVTTNTFDANGNLTQVQDALSAKTSFAYDAIGRRTSLTDAKGHVANFAYDQNGNLVSVTDPLGHSTTYAYDANNNRTGVTDPRGNTTTFAYDANDLLAQVTDALSSKLQFAYDAVDNRISVTDPRGNATQYAYDAANRLITVSDALGKATQLAYDANGNLLTQTNPLGHTSSFAYDELNRLVGATDALGHQGTRTYDALGRLIQSKDASGRITRYAYDALGRLTQVTDPANGTVSYAYDAVGNRTMMTDPNGHTNTFAYDALNRLAQKSDPLGNLYHYAYDAVGNRTSQTDAKGQTLDYAYDASNRLIRIAYPDTSVVQFAYDAAGNRTQMTDKLGITGYVYDALNRLTAYTDPFGKTVTNEYDQTGNRTALVYPDGKRVTYGYDKLNRMATVTDWLGGVTTYSYDDASNLAQMVNPNQTAANYAYDNAERLVKLANAKLVDNSVLASYTLNLDAVGNRIGINRVEPVAPILRSKTETYAYNADNRLLNLNGSDLTYDANGNQTQGLGNTYSYDFDDRLVAVSGSGTADYGYDGTGNRLKAIRNGSETRYTLDIAGPLSNVLVESDGAGSPQAYYVHGLGLISRISPSGGASYYHFDTIGSTAALTDSTGTVTNAYACDAFGQVLNEQSASNAVNNPFRYVGQFGVMEEGNGLQFMRARYYDAAIGRFLKPDQLSKRFTKLPDLNKYAYATNNPVNNSDPSGLTVYLATRSAESWGVPIGLPHSYIIIEPTIETQAKIRNAFPGIDFGDIERITIAGQPTGSFPEWGNLQLSSYGTETVDDNSTKTTIPTSVGNDTFFELMLLQAAETYKNGIPVDYSLTGYNSNSLANSILVAAGGGYQEAPNFLSGVGGFYDLISIRIDSERIGELSRISRILPQPPKK